MSGQLIGDPLEISTLGALKWSLSGGAMLSSAIVGVKNFYL